MTFEIDHIFVCASAGGREAAELIALGLTPGPSGVHAGQGTANKSFIFHNAYLELIWVHDEAEARSSLTERTRLFERWRGRTEDGCPFGICFRPSRGSGASSPPFAGWDYLPRYVPPTRPIHIGANSERLDEPMLFFIATASRPDSWPRQPPLQQGLPLREITRLTWTRPGKSALSPQIETVVNAGFLGIETGRAHALTISFDDEAMGQGASLQPHIPITLKW